MRCSFGKLPLLARLGFCAFVIVPQAHPPRWRFAAPLSYGGAVADERHRRLLLEERAVEADEGLPLQRHDLRLHRRLEEDPRSRGGWVRCFVEWTCGSGLGSGLGFALGLGIGLGLELGFRVRQKVWLAGSGSNG